MTNTATSPAGVTAEQKARIDAEFNLTARRKIETHHVAGSDANVAVAAVGDGVVPECYEIAGQVIKIGDGLASCEGLLAIVADQLEAKQSAAPSSDNGRALAVTRDALTALRMRAQYLAGMRGRGKSWGPQAAKERVYPRGAEIPDPQAKKAVTDKRQN